MNIAYNMDCMEAMREMPDNAFDLAVVDPPYGDGQGGDGSFRYGGMFQASINGRNTREKVTRTGGTWAAKYQKKIVTWDLAPSQEYFDELFRVSKNQIIFGGNYFSLPPTRCFIVYRKTNIPLEGFTMSPVEYAWTSFNQNAGMVECFAQGTKDNIRFHPTQKPVALYAWIYKNYAKEGYKILDTHLGSGSSRIAAYELGLDFVGYEIDKEYFDKQEERFAAYTAQTSLFLGDDGQLNIQEEF